MNNNFRERIYKHLGEDQYKKVEIFYDKGGTNYFSGKIDARGIYISIRNVTRKDEGQWISESFMVTGAGRDEGKQLLLEQNRLNSKTLNKYYDALHANENAIFAALDAGDIHALVRLFDGV